eukprot:scaffold2978_cov155-Ochromonas_danica.AAC.4
MPTDSWMTSERFDVVDVLLCCAVQFLWRGCSTLQHTHRLTGSSTACAVVVRAVWHPIAIATFALLVANPALRPLGEIWYGQHDKSVIQNLAVIFLDHE